MGADPRRLCPAARKSAYTTVIDALNRAKLTGRAGERLPSEAADQLWSRRAMELYSPHSSIARMIPGARR